MLGPLSECFENRTIVDISEPNIFVLLAEPCLGRPVPSEHLWAFPVECSRIRRAAAKHFERHLQIDSDCSCERQTFPKRGPTTVCPVWPTCETAAKAPASLREAEQEVRSSDHWASRVRRPLRAGQVGPHLPGALGGPAEGANDPVSNRRCEGAGGVTSRARPVHVAVVPVLHREGYGSQSRCLGTSVSRIRSAPPAIQVALAAMSCSDQFRRTVDPLSYASAATPAAPAVRANPTAR